MSRDRTGRFIINFATGTILLVSIPILGVLIALPLWHLATNHRALYSAAAIVVVIGIVVRGVHLRR